ncbi:MAG: proton-conducting transporter membrane subunit, partial [Solirubrobacterales bacterium]
MLVSLGLTLLIAGTLAPLGSRALTAAIAFQAVGIALLGVGGALILFGAPAFGAAFRNGLDPALGIDGLTGFFLATLAVVAVPAAIYARGYLAGVTRSRVLVALSGLFLLALVGVAMARDPSSFLACWELMTLVPAAAILVGRSDADVRHAVFVYLAVTHLGGAGVWICVLALAHYGAMSDPAALAAQGAGVQALIIVAAIVGFGTKAGLMPLHSWLPRAHPVAPSHVSALMSGVMIKV